MCDLTESLSIRLRAAKAEPGWKIKKYHLSGCRWQSFLPRFPLLWSRLYRHRLGPWPELWRRGCWGRRPRKQTFDICKEELEFNKSQNVTTHTWKSMMATHTDRRYKSFHTVQSISRLIRLMVVAFACQDDLTYPLCRPDQRQMIMSTGMLKSSNKWCFHIPRHTVSHLIQSLLKRQQWFACSVVLGSEMPGQTRETDIPLWYKAQRGGDELRDLEDAEMKRDGKQRKRRGRGAGDRKEGWHRSDRWSDMRGRREKRERERERGKTTADRQRGAGCERGGGVHAKFELIRQQNSSPLWDFVPYPLLMCVCNYVCPWGGRRRRCLWRESQRWLMVYRRTLMGDSSPPVAAVSVATWVTCNLSPGSEATSPHLRGMRRIHSLCFHPPCVSLNCEVVLRRSKTGCLSAGQRFAGRPSLTSITFTTRSDAKREDVPGCISLPTHMSGYLN